MLLKQQSTYVQINIKTQCNNSDNQLIIKLTYIFSRGRISQKTYF